MKNSDDIANLLKQFGGRPDEYYEIGRASEAKDSQARWPLLSSIEATQGENHPPVEPHAPGATPAAGLGALRARIAPPVNDARVEPRFKTSSEALPASATPPVSASVAAPAAPQAQFVPPRPRGHIVPRTRPTSIMPGNLSSMRQTPPESVPPLPEPLAKLAIPAQHPAPPLSEAPRTVAPSAPATSAGGSTPLQSIFERLARPQPMPEPTTTRDKNASLLQRLSRL